MRALMGTQRARKQGKGSCVWRGQGNGCQQGCSGEVTSFKHIFLFYSFNKLYFIYHKIHLFQMYNSIIFSKFTV